MNHQDKKRVRFFKQLITDLHIAGNEGFTALKLKSEEVMTVVNSNYPTLPADFVDQSHLKHLPRDNYAKSLVPRDVTPNLIPLRCTGDGNCLFRSCSIHVCGEEVMHIELRVRTICELVSHPEYYLHPEIVSFCGGCFDDTNTDRSQSVPRLHATSASLEDAHSNLQQGSDVSALARETFELDCVQTTKMNTYANMWHVHGLSTVLGCPIYSVYPDYNQYIRPLLHKRVLPRGMNSQQQKDVAVYIMWTRTAPMPTTGPWSPSHFVPCIEIGNTSATHVVRLTPPSQTSSQLPTTINQVQPTIKTYAAAVLSQCNNVQSCVTSSCSSTPPNPNDNITVKQQIPNTNVAPMELSLSYMPPTSSIASSVIHISTASTACMSTVSASTHVSTAPPTRMSTVSASTHVSTAPPTCTSTVSASTHVSTTSRTHVSCTSKPTEPTVSVILSLQCGKKQTPNPIPKGTMPITSFFSRSKTSKARKETKYTSKCSVQHSHPPNFDISNVPNATKNVCETDIKPPTVSFLLANHLSRKKPKLHSLPGQSTITKMVSYFDPTHSVQPAGTELTDAVMNENNTETIHSHTPAVPMELSPTHLITVSPTHVSTASPTHDSTASPTHDSTVSPTHLITASPTHLITASPTHLITASPSHLITASPTHLITASPTHMVTASPTHLITASPTHMVTASPTHMVTASPESQCQSDSPDDEVSSSSEAGSLYRYEYLEDFTSSEESDDDTGKLSPSTDQTGTLHDASPLVPGTVSVVDSLAKLPLVGVSPSWYAEQNKMYRKAHQRRDELRKSMSVVKQSNDSLVYMNRSRIKGSIQDNVQQLQLQLAGNLSDSKVVHYKALIEVGQYIIDNGPLVKTQVTGEVYLKSKNLTVKKRSSEYYEIFVKRLNLAQVYIFDVAYLAPNTGDNLERFVDNIVGSINEERILHRNIADRLNHLVPKYLEYMDSHRDRQVMKALLAELTSVKFASRLQGITSRQGTSAAKAAVSQDLHKFADIKTTSQIVRTGLTNLQQYRMTQRIISSRKRKEIRTIAPGRGRKLLCEQFPDLAVALEYAFGELDIQQGGGGLESHPRLTTGTLYASRDNITSMKQAREVLLAMAPEGFHISLSSCYNYTENYRQGSSQAKQHHAGRGVNANISLKKPPRTGVQQLVINIHWSTKNVNIIIDQAEKKPQSLILSKDAKAIVLGDISPVQQTGHSWKKREHPDHSWDQSRKNAITPMSFLFMDTKVTGCFTTEHGDEVFSITRTGQALTLLYLSFFEPDTTMKCMNEILFLLADPSLDHFFRDPVTGKLKKHFVFVVDNGPQERPSNTIVQMCMARLLKFLNLDKITQVSFAEYHSKRNFVERVHAEENKVLAKHGPFNSKQIHSQAVTGSQEHLENMEHMAKEVCACLSTASFGSIPLLSKRGIKQEQFLFDDSKELSLFLDLSEQSKEETEASYHVKQCELLQQLHMIWDVDLDFESTYMADYSLTKTASWKDKYSTTLFSPSIDPACRRQLQPLPDVLRWLNCHELHYMPWKEAEELDEGPWDNIPGAFLPSKVLDLCFAVIQSPPQDIALLFALLAWVKPDDVKRYEEQLKEQCRKVLDEDETRGKWKHHSLYKTNNKDSLEKLCREQKIPVTPEIAKHHLVRLLAINSGEQEPSSTNTVYRGIVRSIPTTVSAISRLPAAKLREILNFHHFPFRGNKDDLVLKVFLLRKGETAAICGHEEEQLKDLIRIFKLLIVTQKRLQLQKHVYHLRTYSSAPKATVVFPPNNVTHDNVEQLFDPLLHYIHKQREARQEHDKNCNIHQVSLHTSPNDIEDVRQCIGSVGAKVKVKWSDDELGDSGWKAGWYVAYVQGYDEDTDELTIEYPSEPGCTYIIALTPCLLNQTITLIQSVL